MSEKSSNQTVGDEITRERQLSTKVMVATGFKLRTDKVRGVLDVYLEAAGQKGQRIGLDPVLLQLNLNLLQSYAASLAFDQDDESEKEDIAAFDEASFANILHVSQ